jgi:two-component system, OmpR family, response regulator
MRVMVVDDDPQIRVLVEAVLLEIAEVTMASSGGAALALLAEDVVDCIVLDVMMPGMSGLEVLDAVRSDLAFSDVAVLLLTALTDEANHVSGFRSGADAYLTKPFDVDVLLAEVMRIVELGADERRRLREEELRRAELLASIEHTFDLA